MTSHCHKEALDLLVQRVVGTWQELGPAWPYHADPTNGAWHTAEGGDWCAGHWIECLRIASERTGHGELLDEAMRRTWEIEPWKEKDDMFRAPMFYYSAARLAKTTGDKRLGELALDVAERMRAMAMPVHGGMHIGSEVRVKSTALRSGTVVAIDNVHPNLILDWYAWNETGDERFITGARRHLDLTIRDFIRDDDSTVEFIDYDPVSGQVIREFTLLGAHDTSCWSRGHAWAIGGYLRAFEELGDVTYLDVARRLLAYWLKNAHEGTIPRWDFAVDEGPLDTSASAILVESIARIAVHPQRCEEARDVTAHLDRLLDDLCRHLTPVGPDDSRPAGMLLDGCFNQPGNFANDHELIWGDFYLLSALHCLEKGGLPC